MAEAETNLAINVLPGALSESFEVQGRGRTSVGYVYFYFLQSHCVFTVFLSLFRSFLAPVRLLHLKDFACTNLFNYSCYTANKSIYGTFRYLNRKHEA